MKDRTCNVLFLCTGNSARSIMAESILNHWGKGLFRGWSAGSHPKGKVHPMALTLLRQMEMPLQGLRSKSWDEFAAPGAPQMDFVFTVCDAAAGETCPVWPGQPVTAHWGLADPAAVTGHESIRMLAFRDAFRVLERRIRLFLALHHREMNRVETQRKVAEIGSIGIDTDTETSA